MLPIVDVYRLDPRGIEFSTEKITCGRGVHRLVNHRIIIDNIEFDPFTPPQEPIKVLLVFSARNTGSATLYPDGSFVQES